MNCVVLLGPTAVGKTALAVQIALVRNGEILSADSRQVYRNLDLGSGKDLADYTFEGKKVPYHLIDIADLKQEYNVFNYQQDFYKAFADVKGRGILPVIAGGTGMYLDAVVRNYDFVLVPENPELRAELSDKKLEELDKILLSLKPELHNKSDLTQKDRVIRAIEIARCMNGPMADEIRNKMVKRPDIQPLVLGTTLPREILRENIAKRLHERLDEGMIEEVRCLHENGASWDRLERLGLEYRFVSEYLEGKIKSEDELFTALNTAIGQFAKRQETWFRGMERKGVKINWLPETPDREEKLSVALSLIDKELMN